MLNLILLKLELPRWKVFNKVFSNNCSIFVAAYLELEEVHMVLLQPKICIQFSTCNNVMAHIRQLLSIVYVHCIWATLICHGRQQLL